MSDTSKHVLRPLSLRAQLEQPKSIAHKSALALSVSALMLSPLALAEEEDIIELDKLQIEERTIDTNPYAEPGAPYKAKVSGDARHVKPLAETPQTINVLTKDQIQDSGRTDLKAILQAQPGVTIGTGENGNAFGDRYIIRGYEARSDVFVDSLRDPGMTIRESFATEQVEISKGPSSTFAGRGTVGGGVNSVTKQASTDYDFTEAKIGLGTDEYRRVELDANAVVSDTVATRINLLQAYEEVPDRDPADRSRNGFALSVAVKPSDKLDLVADVYHLDAKDTPDLGTYIKPNGGRPVKDIPVYLQSQDFLESEVNVGTLRATYYFNDEFRVANALRYGTTKNGYVTTGARGSDRGVNDAFPNTPTVTISSHQGWQDVEYLADQLNFFLDSNLAGQEHKFIFGLEYTDSKVRNGVYTNLNTPGNRNCTTGSSTTANQYCIQDENGNWIDNIDDLMGRVITKGNWDSDWQIKTWSASVMDTVDLNDQWSVFAGVRLDSFDYSNTTQALNVDPVVQTEYAYDDTLWNYHMGLVYQINHQGNVYFSYSTASEINGGESDLGANCGYGGVCVPGNDPDLLDKGDPESVQNIELGTKWNLFNEKLLATAAIFQITKDDVFESVSTNGYAVTGSFNTGKNRVEGLELSLAGNITNKLSGVAGLTMMESEVLKSVNAENEGRALSNFAEESLFAQLRYELTTDFAFGGTASYRSEVYAGQPDSAAGWNATLNDYSYTVPGYTVYDLFATYDVTDKLNARLNLLNVTDKDYYLAAYRSGSFTYIGDARRAILTFTYQL